MVAMPWIMKLAHRPFEHGFEQAEYRPLPSPSIKIIYFVYTKREAFPFGDRPALYFTYNAASYGACLTQWGHPLTDRGPPRSQEEVFPRPEIL